MRVKGRQLVGTVVRRPGGGKRAHTRKERSDRSKLCVFENGPFFIFQPWYILQGWNLIRDRPRRQRQCDTQWPQGAAKRVGARSRKTTQGGGSALSGKAGTQASETVHGTVLRHAVANTLKEHMLLDDYAPFVLSALPCALLQDVRLLTRQNHDFAEFRRVSQSFCEIMNVLLPFSARLNIAHWKQ